MTNYTIRQLFDLGIVSKRLKQVLNILGCSTFEEMIVLSKDIIKVDYIEKSHHLKNELYRAISDTEDLDEIIPELAASFMSKNSPSKVKKIITKKKKERKFKVGDFTESLLMKSESPINLYDLLCEIKKYLPDTYVESIRANLNGDPKKRFVFFLDGYVGLVGKEYDKRFQPYSIANKKAQYAEQRIMEFLSFMEEKHRSPQPHGLEEEESLYRWYLDFTKSSAKELAELRRTFQEYLKEYDRWMFTPFEYAYKRNCDQVRWYVDNNLELPSAEDEPELSSWFNSQLENYTKHKDKRKNMFVELLNFLEDYGIHFYDAKSAKGKAAIKEKSKNESHNLVKESTLTKYIRLFESFKKRENGNEYATQKALLIIAIGNLIQSDKLITNQVILNKDLLTEFADVCIDNVGTASSYNISIPYYYMSEEPFWSLIPKEWVVRDKCMEEDITFDYIEHNYACSIIDNDLYELLSNKDDFASLKKVLVDHIINNNNFISAENNLEDILLTKPKGGRISSAKKSTKGPQTNLKVVFEDETIVNEKAVATFMEVLRRIGLERIYGLGIKWCGIPLIATEENGKYNQKYENGYYVNVNSSTERKQKQLYDIAEAFNLSIHVDIIDERGDVLVKEQQKRETSKFENAVSILPNQNNDSIIERFLAYVRRDHNDRTARWYAYALQHQVREWITRVVGTDTDSVFGFNTIEEVSSCINTLKNSSEFMEENRRKRNVMTAALNKYYMFLQSSYAKPRS